MNEAMDPTAPAIGACLNCRSLFLMLPETPNCLLCGRPPTYTLILTPVPLKPAEEAPDEPVEYHPSTAPPEELPPAADVAPSTAGEEAPEDLEPGEDSPFRLMVQAIRRYLIEGEGELPLVRQAFLNAGARPEEALAAGSNLQAVGDLMSQLWERWESEPIAPMQPPPEGPDEEA